MYKYEIIIAPNDEGGYYARIPDIPLLFLQEGCQKKMPLKMRERL